LIKGTLNVLNSCANSPSLKCVVLTSSVAAVAYHGKPRTPDVVDETWFTDADFLVKSNLCASQKPYSLLHWFTNLPTKLFLN